jgi:hypothetical protein
MEPGTPSVAPSTRVAAYVVPNSCAHVGRIALAVLELVYDSTCRRGPALAPRLPPCLSALLPVLVLQR